MLESLRIALFRKALRAALAAQKRTRKTHTTDSASAIGILFDATADKNRQDVLEYVRSLEKKGKKVRLCGYFKSKQPPQTTPDFDFFFQKELRWTGQPKAEKAAAFSKEKFDLLLVFNPNDEAPLAWIAATSLAAMKIGYPTTQPNDFDMLLEVPSDKGIRYFTEQLHIYLEKIVLTKNESARAL